MDKITQTIFETILVKLEKIEKILINQGNIPNPINPTNKINRKPGIRYASDNQIKYAIRLGGDPWEGITFEEISKMIDEGKERKNSVPQKVGRSVPEEIEKKFNKEFEKTGLKPLTKEQINEIGENALL